MAQMCMEEATLYIRSFLFLQSSGFAWNAASHGHVRGLSILLGRSDALKARIMSLKSPEMDKTSANNLGLEQCLHAV